MTRRVTFNDAYEAWRNRARKYDRESIVWGALGMLCEPSPDRQADLCKAPWLTMLMVKWVCQDRYLDGRRSAPITREQLDDLRQRLWEFPARGYTKGRRKDGPVANETDDPTAATARPESGTRCSSFAFMRSGGTVEVAASSSTSSQTRSADFA